MEGLTLRACLWFVTGIYLIRSTAVCPRQQSRESPPAVIGEEGSGVDQQKDPVLMEGSDVDQEGSNIDRKDPVLIGHTKQYTI